MFSLKSKASIIVELLHGDFCFRKKSNFSYSLNKFKKNVLVQWYVSLVTMEVLAYTWIPNPRSHKVARENGLSSTHVL